MSRLTDLIAQVARSNPTLAEDLRREVGVLNGRRPVGPTFERHLPETVQLPERKVRRGDKVVFRAPRGESDHDLDRRPWVVSGFEGKGTRRTATLTIPGQQGDSETTTAWYPISWSWPSFATHLSRSTIHRQGRARQRQAVSYRRGWRRSTPAGPKLAATVIANDRRSS